MKNKFNARWIIRRAELVAAAKKEVQSYLDDPRNTFEIRRNIAELKKNFWEPPLPENQSREKIIASPFNVTFLFLEAKLKSKKLSVRKALKLFDAGEKGYLVYKGDDESLDTSHNTAL